MVRVKISGELAVFSRAEAKVERASYEVLTPSAARNILDSISWRPEMRWVVTRIAVLKPIRFISIRRNEVQSKVSPSEVKKWMAAPATYTPLAAGAGSAEATPRNSLLLRDVSYIVDAYPLVFDPTGDNTPQKYEAMLNRRVEKGQCYTTPYLGCREFPARFEPAHDEEAVPVTRNLGRMLYDIVFKNGENRPVFFEARLDSGVLDTRPELVLSEGSREEVLRCSYKR